MRFSCKRCGSCCSGAPGYVWVTQSDIEVMSVLLKVPLADFVRDYVLSKYDKYSLKEKPNGDCVFFFRQNGTACCLVYEVRPQQCKSYPFWDYYVSSEERWKELAKDCPGASY